jgi:hypothetical protein
MADVILRHPNQLLPSPSIIDIHTVELVFVGYASFDLQPPAFSCRLFSHGTFPAQALMRDYCNSLCLLIGLPCLRGWRARCKGVVGRRVVVERAQSPLWSTATTTTKARDNKSEDGAWEDPHGCRIRCYIGGENQGNRGGGGRRDSPPGSRPRRGVGDSNPMLALLM